jgi:aminodeoxyfutalosine synthase
VPVASSILVRPGIQPGWRCPKPGNAKEGDLQTAPILDAAPLTPLLRRRLDRAGLAGITEKVLAGSRLDGEDGLALYARPDAAAVGLLANVVRERLHGDRTYFVRNRHLNPTNVCEADCLFCAFKADPGDPRGWTMTREDVQRRIREMVTEDIREVHVVGGHNPQVGYAYFVDTLRWIKEVRPEVHVKAYTMAEIAFFSKISGKPVEEVVADLRAAGLDACTGGGAEILGERVRKKIVRGKIDGDGWIDTARRVHRMGVKSNCTMLYGHVERDEDRVDHLLRLRALQDETGGFQAFIPLAFHNENNRLRKLNPPTGLDDLKNLAIGRLVLDNVPHVKAYWPMHTPELAQLALRMGVDDVDGTVVEEHIYHMAGARTEQALAVAEIVDLIRKAGRIPVERDALYGTVREHPA